MKHYDPGHYFPECAKFALSVLGHQSSESPVVDDIRAGNAWDYLSRLRDQESYIDICEKDDEKHVQDEVPSKGDEHRVLIEGQVLSIFLFQREYAKGEQVESLGRTEESDSDVEEKQDHRGRHQDVVRWTVKEPEQTIIPITY